MQLVVVESASGIKPRIDDLSILSIVRTLNSRTFVYTWPSRPHAGIFLRLLLHSFPTLKVRSSDVFQHDTVHSFVEGGAGELE